MTLSVIDLINLRYRDVIAAKKDTCEPVPRNSVTVNKIAPKCDPDTYFMAHMHGPNLDGK
jgi:hypothetical protein